VGVADSHKTTRSVAAWTRRPVEILWMDRRKPVNGTTEIIILRVFPAEVVRPTDPTAALRTLLRLHVTAR
jgi:hypothetical protein